MRGLSDHLTRQAPSQPWEADQGGWGFWALGDRLLPPAPLPSTWWTMAGDHTRLESPARLLAGPEGSAHRGGRGHFGWSHEWGEPTQSPLAVLESHFPSAVPALLPPPRSSRVLGASWLVPRVLWQQLLVLTNETPWQLRWARSAPAGTACPRQPPEEGLRKGLQAEP